ncbi:AbrB family transcriptional regulator [Roseibium aestuarii]|uniref:AbrB family transcriptional regulator n=1 Tax=Roseibium aestuarii TaxID=2600299 RepID=A0ABW4JWG7_9HYPH|nr:AbrB family transcriptional regulator [Roseibium aestuarii]
MPFLDPAPDARSTLWTTLARTALTGAIGALGGALFMALGIPAGWMSGAMVLVAAAALARLPVALPPRLRDALFVVLGLSMGAGVTPEVVERIGQWPATMAGLVAVVALVTAATYVYLRHLMKWDPASAYFGALPGALSYVMALASERDVNLPKIAASQSIRLLVLVCVLPLVISSTAGHAPHGFEGRVLPSLTELAILGILCLAASALAARVGLPGGWLTGAFFMSSALNATGTIPVALPEPVLIPCFIGLGCFIGSRFTQTTLSAFVRLIAVGMGAVIVGLAVSVGFAWVLAVMLDLPLGQLILAYAPGGLEVMTLMAFMLDLDPAFVAAHQLVRYIGMVLLLPLVTAVLLGRTR